MQFLDGTTLPLQMAAPRCLEQLKACGQVSNERLSQSFVRNHSSFLFLFSFFSKFLECRRNQVASARLVRGALLGMGRCFPWAWHKSPTRSAFAASSQASRTVFPKSAVTREACAGANMSAKDSLGATPLHRACSALQLNAVLALLEARAPTEVRDNEGNTALHVAIGVATTRTTAEIAFALVRAGASLDAANAAGFTAAALAGENLPELAAAAAAAGSADAPGGDSAMQDA